jgi:hypothetical protein
MVCNEPGAISDGYVTASKSRYGIHDAVGYICHQGYSLVGSPLITCNGSHWTAKPTCSLNIMDNGKFICNCLFYRSPNESTPGFEWGSCCTILIFLCSVLWTIVWVLFFFIWPMYCMSFVRFWLPLFDIFKQANNQM